MLSPLEKAQLDAALWKEDAEAQKKRADFWFRMTGLGLVVWVVGKVVSLVIR